MRKADNLPLSCVVVMKSGNLNFLEPSGTLQACNGTALPLLSELCVKWPTRSFSVIIIIIKLLDAGYLQLIT